MAATTESPKPHAGGFLGAVERIGNKVPHPAVLFFLLILLIVLLSVVLSWLGVGASYQRMNLTTHQPETATTTVNSLLSAEGIRFIFTSVVPNFVNFGPVGIIVVAMIGIGLAERSGLIGALIRGIVLVAPRRALTPIIVTLGVLSSIASDAGYLVLIPLGAIAFHSVGRHPLAGLAAAFSGVAAAFGANILVKPIDGILAEMTNDAIHIVDPSKSIALTANFYFGIVSSVVLIVVCSLVTDRIVEPRLGTYEQAAAVKEDQGLSAQELRGLKLALATLGITLIALGLLTVLPGAPLRDPSNGELLGSSPFMQGLVFIITLVFLIPGIAYGVGAKTITTIDAGIDAATKAISDLGGLLLLFFIISQFVAYFNFSNIGTILAVRMAEFLQHANLGPVPLLLAFLLIGGLMGMLIPAILPKWAIMAPVFIPLFMKLGISPDAVLAAYRVSDSPTNVINPLLPHLALVVGFVQRWQKTAGLGTIVSMMLPYTITTFVAWSALFFAWYLLGLPFGPG